jgi:hypothetical protein
VTWGPRAAGATIGAALLLAGCAAQPPVEATRTAGSDGRQIQVLVDQPAVGALGTDIQQFVATRQVRVSWGGGTPDAIATTVKDGYRISVVVLPSGPALDRIRDELVAPPTALGTLGSATYWAAPVDQFGLPLVRFLTGRTSQRVLRAQGFGVPA